MPLLTYTGNKTAYQNNQSYWPGEVFWVPDERVKVIDGVPTTIKFKLSQGSKMRLATDAEEKEYQKKNPRYARRQESVEALDRKEEKRKVGRPANPMKADKVQA